MIDTTGLDQSAVLAALFNASRPQGMGFLQYNPEPMSTETALELLTRTRYFDYIQGRVMKINLKDPNQFDEWGYDRDNGEGSAQMVIDSLRKTNSPNNDSIQMKHSIGTEEAPRPDEVGEISVHLIRLKETDDD